MWRFNLLAGLVLMLLLPAMRPAADSGMIVQAQPVRISSDVDSLRAGQRFEVYIVFENAQENFNSVIFPDSSAFEDPFEYRDAARGITPEGGDSLRVSLQFFGSEDATLPETTAFGIADGQDTTAFAVPELDFYFTSTLAEDANLRPLKPLFEFSRSWWPWISGGLLLVALLGGGYYYWRRYLKNRPPEPEPEPYRPPPPFVNPLQELEKEITALRRLWDTTAPDLEEIYVKSSQAVRRYYRAVYRFPALEYTTREVVRELEKRRLNQGYMADVRGLLNESDMVKFARFSPDAAQTEAHIAKAEKLLKYVQTHDREMIHQLYMEHAAKYRPQATGHSEASPVPSSQAGPDAAIVQDTAPEPSQESPFKLKVKEPGGHHSKSNEQGGNA